METYSNTQYLKQVMAWGAPKAANSSNNNALLLFAFLAGAAVGYYLAIHKLKKAVYTSTPLIPLTNETVSALSEKETAIDISEKNTKNNVDSDEKIQE